MNRQYPEKRSSTTRFPTKKGVWGWVLYDCGNSAFATTIMAGFFPVFFKHYWSYQSDINTSTAMLGFGNSLASLLVAFIASILVLFLLGLLLFYLAGKEEARSLTK